jgi:hypothetical protein
MLLNGRWPRFDDADVSHNAVVPVAVEKLPTCDFCLDRSEYYGRTAQGREAYMCARHLRQKGNTAGIRPAQRLILI